MTNPKDNALRDRLAEAADYYTSVYDDKLNNPNYRYMKGAIRHQKEEIQEHFKAGYITAEANLLSTHPVVLELVKALEKILVYTNESNRGQTQILIWSREALEAYRESKS